VRFKDKQGRETTLIQRRFVHIDRMHLAALETTIIPENWSGRIHVLSGLDGTVINAGVERYKQLNSKHLEPIRGEAVDDETICLLVETNQSRLRWPRPPGPAFIPKRNGSNRTEAVERPGYIGQEFFIDAAEKKPVKIEKIVSCYTSRDFAISEPVLDAVEAVGHATVLTNCFKATCCNGTICGSRCDIRLENSDRPQMILRLHIFHLLQTVSRNSIELDIGVPARGWHGEAYRGHIFWDELFIFPYLNLRIPDSPGHCFCTATGGSTKPGWRLRRRG
jgi:trehalose/maltose hydrolase-like predicted phosphorylase